MSLSDLPSPVATYIEATNAFDLDRLVATFDDGALVNDHRCEFRGKDAIRNWAAKEIVGDRVTLQVTETVRRGDNIAVTANIDGNFDKSALPDPLPLTFYFSVSGDRIMQLIIVFNKPAA